MTNFDNKNKKLIKSHIKENNKRIDNLRNDYNVYTKIENTLNVLSTDERKKLVDEYYDLISKLEKKNYSIVEYYQKKPNEIVSSLLLLVGICGISIGTGGCLMGNVSVAPAILGVGCLSAVLSIETGTKMITYIPANVVYSKREKKINRIKNYRNQMKTVIENDANNSTKESEKIAEYIKELETKLPKKYSQLKNFNKQVEVEQGKE